MTHDPKLSAIQKAAIYVDGWVNTWTKLGTSLDSQTHTRFVRPARLPDEELSSLYHHDDIARIVCEVYPSEALRRGFGELPPEVAADFERLRVREVFGEAAALGRAFGGAAVVVGIEGQPAKTPWTTPGRVTFLGLHDRRYVHRDIASRNTNPESPNYGKSTLYRVQSATGGTDTIVHRSRMIFFGGAPTAEREREELDGWDYSVLQSIYPWIRSYSNAHLAAGSMLSSATEGILKMRGLISAIAGGRREDLETRATLMDLGRSVAKTVMIDAEGEEYTKISTSFAGIPDMIDRFASRLSVATGIPQSVLAGHRTVGLGDTGASELRAWYDRVEAYRANEIDQRLKRFCELAYGRPLELEWPSLWQPTDNEVADLQVKRAQRDQIYVASEVVLPEEVDVSDIYPARDLFLRAPVGDPGDEPEPVESDDVPTVDAATTLAEQMTAAGVDRCEHGRTNRCPLCGVERARGIQTGEDGAVGFIRGTWRALA